EQELDGEGALVVVALVGEQLREQGAALLGDRIRLAGATRGAGAQAHPRRGEVALERTGGDEGAGGTAGCLVLVDLGDGAGALEPAQGRIQRAERDAPERAERLGQALFQVVPVARLLGEQPEYRQ